MSVFTRPRSFRDGRVAPIGRFDAMADRCAGAMENRYAGTMTASIAGLRCAAFAEQGVGPHDRSGRSSRGGGRSSLDRAQ